MVHSRQQSTQADSLSGTNPVCLDLPILAESQWFYPQSKAGRQKHQKLLYKLSEPQPEEKAPVLLAWLGQIPDGEPWIFHSSPDLYQYYWDPEQLYLLPVGQYP